MKKKKGCTKSGKRCKYSNITEISKNRNVSEHLT